MPKDKEETKQTTKEILLFFTCHTVVFVSYSRRSILFRPKRHATYHFIIICRISRNVTSMNSSTDTTTTYSFTVFSRSLFISYVPTLDLRRVATNVVEKEETLIVFSLSTPDSSVFGAWFRLTSNSVPFSFRLSIDYKENSIGSYFVTRVVKTGFGPFISNKDTRATA